MSWLGVEGRNGDVVRSLWYCSTKQQPLPEVLSSTMSLVVKIHCNCNLSKEESFAFKQADSRSFKPNRVVRTFRYGIAYEMSLECRIQFNLPVVCLHKRKSIVFSGAKRQINFLVVHIPIN